MVSSSPMGLSRPRAGRATNGGSWEKTGMAPTPAELRLHAPALARPTTVMRNRRHIANRRNGEARRLQGTQRRFTTSPPPRDLHFKHAHPDLLRPARHILASNLRRAPRRFARRLDTHR